MPELPYMPFYINDYLGDTQALTAEQHGAYLLLIFHYWNSGRPISADDSELSLIARIDSSRWMEDVLLSIRSLQLLFEDYDGSVDADDLAFAQESDEDYYGWLQDEHQICCDERDDRVYFFSWRMEEFSGRPIMNAQMPFADYARHLEVINSL